MFEITEETLTEYRKRIKADNLLIKANNISKSRKQRVKDLKRKKINYDEIVISAPYVFLKILEKPYCIYCKSPYDLSPGLSDLSPSMDKVFPELGYVEGNIAFCCHRCNRIKNDINLDERSLLMSIMDEMQIISEQRHKWQKKKDVETVEVQI